MTAKKRVTARSRDGHGDGHGTGHEAVTAVSRGDGRGAGVTAAANLSQVAKDEEPVIRHPARAGARIDEEGQLCRPRPGS